MHGKSPERQASNNQSVHLFVFSRKFSSDVWVLIAFFFLYRDKASSYTHHHGILIVVYTILKICLEKGKVWNNSVVCKTFHLKCHHFSLMTKQDGKLIIHDTMYFYSLLNKSEISF